MIGKLFRAIWTGVDGFRKVIHLVLMIFVFVVMLAALGSGTAAVKIKDGNRPAAESFGGAGA